MALTCLQTSKKILNASAQVNMAPWLKGHARKKL